ncbi:acyltransferase [Pseudomonas sp. AP19]|nr:acyltransferase [Pseudomonas sp. AP19]
MQFRKSINALRALAVLSVVLFHFQISGFAGGFVGVDVFFVISGFLMTGIIFKGLQAQNFSIMSFYVSRARRIIPALLILCAALLIFGFIYLPLDDYREAIRSIKSSLFFSSNFMFAKTGNYFDAPLHENWLLHTWSLSVEWQFYLVYPLILMGLHKLFGTQKTKISLIFLAIASLATSIYLSNIDPVFAFYMLPTRAWELIVGGLVFLYPLHFSRRLGYACEGLGLAAILMSIFCFTEQDTWPGYLALVPVLGAALVISANSQSIFGNNRALQFTGTVSYSVYLWHWPLVVFLYTCGLLNSLPHVVGAIILSFVMGTLSFYFVESKTNKKTSPRKAVIQYICIVVVMVGISAITSSVVKDHPEVRFAYVDLGRPEYTSKLYDRECYPNPYGAADCKLGSGEVSVILFGDSHAESTAAAVQMENKQAALSWARGGCPILQNFDMHDKDLADKCHGFMREKLDKLANSYQGIPVILFSRAAMYLDSNRGNSYHTYITGQEHLQGQEFINAYTSEYAKTVCSISEHHPVYIVRPIPEMPFSVYKGLNLHKRIFQNESDISISLLSYQKRNHDANNAIDAAAKQCNATVIDPTPYLCPNGQCMGSKNGVALYYDDNHLVDAGNEQLKGLFRNVMK